MPDPKEALSQVEAELKYALTDLVNFTTAEGAAFLAQTNNVVTNCAAMLLAQGNEPAYVYQHAKARLAQIAALHAAAIEGRAIQKAIDLAIGVLAKVTGLALATLASAPIPPAVDTPRVAAVAPSGWTVGRGLA